MRILRCLLCQVRREGVSLIFVWFLPKPVPHRDVVYVPGDKEDLIAARLDELPIMDDSQVTRVLKKIKSVPIN